MYVHAHTLHLHASSGIVASTAAQLTHVCAVSQQGSRRVRETDQEQRSEALERGGEGKTQRMREGAGRQAARSFLSYTHFGCLAANANVARIMQSIHNRQTGG